MTTLRVDAEAIQALGADLTALATVLGSLESAASAHAGDLGHRRVSGGLDGLLGDWTLVRHQLAGTLRDLGTAAEEAGHAYLVVERGITDAFGGGI